MKTSTSTEVTPSSLSSSSSSASASWVDRDVYMLRGAVCDLLARQTPQEEEEEPSTACSSLRSSLPFYVRKTERENLETTLGWDTDRIMIAFVYLMKTFAVQPISNFNVGSAALCRTGEVCCGTNVEFANTTLGNTIHAEQCTVAMMILKSHSRMRKLYVSEFPCGHCRQFLNEMSGGGKVEVHIVRGADERIDTTLEVLLPYRFGPSNIGVHEPLFHNLDKKNQFRNCCTTVMRDNSDNSNTDSDGIIPCPSSSLEGIAAEVRKKNLLGYSYAPHSGVGACVRVTTRTSGNAHFGLYIENAAFNPSLEPLQVACVSLLAEFIARRRCVPATPEEVRDLWRSIQQVQLLEAAAAAAEGDTCSGTPNCGGGALGGIICGVNHMVSAKAMLSAIAPEAIISRWE